MDPSLQALLARLDRLAEEFKDNREGVQKAVLVADLDPEMALTRARKVLEYVVREVYERRCGEPPGTRPLENLIQRLVKDGHFPDRLVWPRNPPLLSGGPPRPTAQQAIDAWPRLAARSVVHDVWCRQKNAPEGAVLPWAWLEGARS
jgi:hypothetical protein